MCPSRNEDVASPSSPAIPSPTPTPSPTGAGRLFAAFRQPTPDPEPSPSSPPADTPSPTPPPPDAAPSWSTDEPAEPSPDRAASSGTLSIGRSGRVSKVGLKTAVGGGFKRLCRLVAVFAADEVERTAGLWEPDEDDVEGVAEPAANLIYRRVPEEARGGDVLDLIQLGLALAGYVGKQVQYRAALAKHRAMTDTLDTPTEGGRPQGGG